jgi:hypothetical protein
MKLNVAYNFGRYNCHIHLILGIYICMNKAILFLVDNKNELVFHYFLVMPLSDATLT